MEQTRSLCTIATDKVILQDQIALAQCAALKKKKKKPKKYNLKCQCRGTPQILVAENVLLPQIDTTNKKPSVFHNQLLPNKLKLFPQ